MLLTLQFERIAVFQPVIRGFLLETVHDLLLEHTIVVTDAAAVCMVAARSKGVHEAGCQSSQTAVSECRIRFLIFQCVEIETDIGKRILNACILAEIEQVVAEGTANQELHGEVIYDLGVVCFKSPAGLHPVLDDICLDNVGYSLIKLLLRCILKVFSVKHLNGCSYQVLEFLFIKSAAFHKAGILLCQISFRPFLFPFTASRRRVLPARN